MSFYKNSKIFNPYSCYYSQQYYETPETYIALLRLQSHANNRQETSDNYYYTNTSRIHNRPSIQTAPEQIHQRSRENIYVFSG